MSKSYISSPMKKSIKSIELALGVKYKGKTFEEASEFISKYKDKSMKIDLREKMKPSSKMLDKIKMIEDIFGKEFKGESMLDASIFLDTNLPLLIDYFDKRKNNSNSNNNTNLNNNINKKRQDNRRKRDR